MHSDEKTPLDELRARWERCQAQLRARLPESGGLLVFSRLNIYYLAGTFANGVLWLPREGEPVLLCRRGLERARLESRMERILPFRSYQDLPGLLAEAGSPLARRAGAEMSGLSWGLGRSFQEKLPQVTLDAGDRVLAAVRAVKSPRELAVLREAGARHAECLTELLPRLISPGMSEREVSHRAWEVFFSRGHMGMLRMETYGEEVFLGHVAAGENANYPSVYNGPVGLRGEHPAVPFMGSSRRTWLPGEPLVCDVGFNLEGYQTDKTQVYWGGGEGTVPPRVRAAHDFCVELQSLLAARLKPGTAPSSLAEEGFRLAAKAGWEEGFMALGGNKVRFVGHGLGLAIDEYPALAPGFDEPLEEGMVLALEPKIGIPGLGMVGVENTFEVTGSGGRCLTGSYFGLLCLS